MYGVGFARFQRKRFEFLKIGAVSYKIKMIAPG
jgi:hypothetical protein